MDKKLAEFKEASLFGTAEEAWFWAIKSAEFSARPVSSFRCYTASKYACTAADIKMFIKRQYDLGLVPRESLNVLDLTLTKDYSEFTSRQAKLFKLAINGLERELRRRNLIDQAYTEEEIKEDDASAELWANHTGGVTIPWLH